MTDEPAKKAFERLRQSAAPAPAAAIPPPKRTEELVPPPVGEAVLEPNSSQTENQNPTNVTDIRDKAVAATVPARSARPRASTPRQSSTGTDTQQPTWVDAAVWIPVSLKQQLDADLGAEGLTIAERIVLAFNRQFSNLDSMFPTGPMAQASGPMPTVRSTRRRRTGGEGTTLLRVRLAPEQKAVLDEQVTRLGTNRSILVSRILAADLS